MSTSGACSEAVDELLRLQFLIAQVTGQERGNTVHIGNIYIYIYNRYTVQIKRYVDKYQLKYSTFCLFFNDERWYKRLGETPLKLSGSQ